MRAPSASPPGTVIGQRLGPYPRPVAAAGMAPRFRLAAGTAAQGTRLGEHHVPARRLHDARAVTLRAPALLHLEVTGAAAGAAVLVTGDRQLPLAAPHRVFEAEIDRLMQIGAAQRLGFRAALLALPQHVSEEVAEGRRRRSADAGGEVEPFKTERGRLHSRPGRAHGVVPPPAIGIAERLVRFRDLTELRRRRAVAWVDVRVEPPRQTPVRALDHRPASRRAPTRESNRNPYRIAELQDYRIAERIAGSP